jgi:hypothetical protein
MTATEALKAARAAGIDIRMDGDKLVLAAAAPPPQAVLEELSRYKAAILPLLRRGRDGLRAEDWWALFEERTRVAECDAGLPRSHAEAIAFKACVTTWLNRNPVNSPAGLCIVCRRGDQPDDVVLPYGTTPPGAAWLHAACWPTWWQERQDQAIRALETIGITSPTA